MNTEQIFCEEDNDRAYNFRACFVEAIFFTLMECLESIAIEDLSGGFV